MKTDTASWQRKGHKVEVGPVERIETTDRFGRQGYQRAIWIDDKLIGFCRGQDLVKAKWRAAEELERVIRQDERKTE